MVATGLAPVVLNETQVIRKPVTKEYDPHGAYPSSNKQWYTLVRLDEYALCSGGPDDELRELEERILSEPDDTSDDDALETNSGTSVGDETETTGEDLDPEAELQLPREPHCNPAYQKPGGPCDHCGAADSPQWRRGPASKPMLCNACGTRYRRTNTLGPSTPVHRVASAPVLPKKRSPPQSPSGLNPAKKVRCASAEDLAGEHFGRAVGVRA